VIRCAIDVSHHQGSIKWSQVPATITCVMIKASQGSSYNDPAFMANRDGAQDTGRRVIPYHFLDNSSIQKQFNNFSTFIDMSAGDVVAIDWEAVSKSEPHPPVTILEQFGDLCFSATGRSPLVYHSIYDLASPKINKWPWWIPKYGPEPRAGLRWLFWQFSSQGRMHGINSPVDLSMFWGSDAELRDWFEHNRLPRGL
jgi:lysozyme